MSFKKIALAALTITVSSIAIMASPAEAREQVRIVGSSTVYPFVSAAAEDFGKNSKFKTPIVESTGTGGGMKLFCSGTGDKFPDIVNASRKIKSSELELCKQNGVKDIQEIKIGYDGIVFAYAKEYAHFDLTKEQIFKAIARKVAVDGKLIDNPYKTWDQIHPSLPKHKIEVYGPPPTSGTRDALTELVMVPVCEKSAEFKKAYPDESERELQCKLVREDGGYIDAGENDNIIIQKLRANHDTLGIFGFSYYDQNTNLLQAAKVDGTEPEFDKISDGSYSVSRSLYIYSKLEHKKVVPGLQEFLEFVTSEEVAGQDGTLSMKGLIPAHEKEREEARQKVKEGSALMF